MAASILEWMNAKFIDPIEWLVRAAFSIHQPLSNDLSFLSREGVQSLPVAWSRDKKLG